ncbi:S1 family peptidase [Aeromicrobium sp. CF4.19]|uniref:S1 family peptidase n=1 Tax=Aeromicrobium sp. CF4.19 TaxID=3373082 RepID=UPI003EE70803
MRAAPTEREAVVVHGTGSYQPSPEELKDFAYFSDEEDSATREALRSQMPFEDFVADVRERHGDIYAGSGLNRVKSADAYLAFTVRPPESVFEGLEQLPLDVQVRWGYPSSSEELLRASDAAVAAVSESIGPEGMLASEISDDDDAIHIWYSQGEADENFSAAHAEKIELGAKTAIAEGAFDGRLPVEVIARLDPDLQTAGEAEVYGNAQMRSTSGLARCTAGFTAARSGQRGLVTAGHCMNKMRFGFNVGWIQFVTDFPATPNGNRIDVQFHRTISGTAAPAKFRATSLNTFRTLKSRRDPVKGGRVCKYGMSTGYTCAYIYRAENLCYKYSGYPTFCGLAAVDRHYSSGGDSGAGVFLAQAAYGIHSGVTRNGRSIFTKSSTVANYLNAFFRTQ